MDKCPRFALGLAVYRVYDNMFSEHARLVIFAGAFCWAVASFLSAFRAARTWCTFVPTASTCWRVFRGSSDDVVSEPAAETVQSGPTVQFIPHSNLKL